MNQRFVCLFLAVMLSAAPGAIAQQSFRYDVKNGIDVVVSQNFSMFQNQKITLVTNQSGRMRTLASTLDAFLAAKSCKVISVLTPEHGYYGLARAGDAVQDTDVIYGINSFSLYGKTRRPTKAMLAACDAVVFDIQDVGVRPYTYLGTLYNVMDACAEFGKPLTILDRPNPLGGKIMDGAVLDTTVASFVGIIPIPYVHGCTLAELAQLINGEGWLPHDSTGKPRRCQLTVVKAEGWQRWMTWEDTDFQWIPTSPHVPSIDAVRGMAVIGLLGELSLFSVGVGFTSPFQLLGSPLLNPDLVLEALRRTPMNSLALVPTRFRPFYNKFANTDCNGILLTFFPDATRFRPFTAGLELMLALRAVHPEFFAPKSITDNLRSMFTKVAGSDKLFDLLFVKKSPDEEVRKFATKGVKEFGELRKKYLLYD